MENFIDKERKCSLLFSSLEGEVYHLWTPESFPLIFTSDEDFKIGMGIIGLAAKVFPDVRILTFEIMSNHLHFVACGEIASILAMFELIKSLIKRFHNRNGRSFDEKKFHIKYRVLESLNDVRNVIIYDNRNGFVVSPECTPFTYPWGANRYYFNPDACRLAIEKAKQMTVRDRRRISFVHEYDDLNGLLSFDGYALPLSFCDIRTGEALFRDASHYFNRVSKSMETNSKIAQEIGESIYYTDDDLYAAVSIACRKKYDQSNPALLPASIKMTIAKEMRFEYHASAKQISRILKLDPIILQSAGY